MNLLLALPVVTFVLFLGLQFFFPRRRLGSDIKQRVFSHAGLFLVNIIVVRLLPFISLVVVAKGAAQNNFGLLNWLDLASFDTAGFWIVVALSVVILDFAIYWQHVATHKWDWLWRFHKVHHSDPDFEVSTAIRFHPVELVLSLVYKAACVALLGAPVVAVLVFEFLLLFGAQFSHSNIKLPNRLDAILRTTIATPDVHRIHHSVHRHEHDTNYGFFLIWWDKLFGTYSRDPQESHENMRVGLSYIAASDAARLDKMLSMPVNKP
jgi:sterol desaturase/sphingolipid hydroxylase (fatty acid hydroxylase superfamily)